MSFLIKQISHTADGREIVRPTRIDKPSITIGRNAGCDIHLADLAVTPTHAVVDLIDQRRISVKAAGTLGFGIDGRNAQTVEIDATKGAHLRFGSHRLKVSAEAGDIVFAVERVEALSDASGDKDEQKVFSLRGLMPGKRASAWGFVALVLVAFLAFPIWSYASSRGEKIRADQFHADSTWTSGSLSKAHAGLEKDCQSCHVDAFVAVRDDACITCHAQSHDGQKKATLRPASLTTQPAAGETGPSAYDHAPKNKMAASVPAPGLGGQITQWFQGAFNVPQGRCVECHTEHEGAGPMPATAQAFCSDCHTGLGPRLKAAGIKSEIGDASDFGLNHPQLKPVILAGYSQAQGIPFERRDARIGGNPLLGWNLKRASLDRPLRQDGGLKFTHAQHLSTSNNVSQMWRRTNNAPAMDCADCHRTDQTGTRYLPVDMETSCQSCHSLGIQTIGGVVRQLPHGQPVQVIADIRAFYSSAGAFRPSGPPMARYNGPMDRRRPGEIGVERRADDAARGRAAFPGAANGLIQQTFGPRGVCGECHQVSFGGPGGVTIAPVAQPVRYLHKGWFDHRPHVGLAVRGANNGGSRVWGCRDCHVIDQAQERNLAAPANQASHLLLPDLASCQACHTGENGGSRAKLVRAGTPSGCAMCHDYHADFGAPWSVKKRDSKAKGRVALLDPRGR